jgi:hypothetical protein
MPLQSRRQVRKYFRFLILGGAGFAAKGMLAGFRMRICRCGRQVVEKITLPKDDTMQSRIRFFSVLVMAAIVAGIGAFMPSAALAIGTETCPGRLITIPAAPDSFVDAGNTNNMRNNCVQCGTDDPGGSGRDVFYYFDLTHSTYLLISTCGSAYNTYICLFKDSCCSGDRVPLVSNDQDPSLCPQFPNQAIIATCLINPARYYLVVSGPNAGAYGSYQIILKELPQRDCGESPRLCTAGYDLHTEGADEAVCEHAFTTMPCPHGYCGAIDRRGDRDVYEFVLTECKTVTLSAYGNDSPNRSSTGSTLNPRLRLFAGPACDHPLYTNDDNGGTDPAPVGKDSRINADCLRPGTYWAEISGDTTVGKYEFYYECAPCTRPANPIGPVNVQSPQTGRYCVSWPAQGGASIYYVWRYELGTWTLAGTTRTIPFCETFLDSGALPNYEVFTDPCGIPQVPSR